MENPKSGLVGILKVKLDRQREITQNLAKKLALQRKENRLLKKQLNQQGQRKI